MLVDYILFKLVVMILVISFKVVLRLNSTIIIWLLSISFLENQYKYPCFPLQWYCMHPKYSLKENHNFSVRIDPPYFSSSIGILSSPRVFLLLRFFTAYCFLLHTPPLQQKLLFFLALLLFYVFSLLCAL